MYNWYVNKAEEKEIYDEYLKCKSAGKLNIWKHIVNFLTTLSKSLP